MPPHVCSHDGAYFCVPRLWILLTTAFLLTSPANSTAGPLRVSPNGPYFVDAATNKPFFWLSNTQWAIFRGYTIDEARTTIDSIKNKGYTVLTTMLAGGPVATAPEWWLLTPDQSVLASGANASGDVLHLAARHRVGNWAIIYSAEPHTFSVAMNKLSGKMRAWWIDPKTGESKPAGSYRNTGEPSVTTPAGWEDAVLLLVPPRWKQK